VVGKSLSHYKILSGLGRGGMGIVYKATDIKLDRTVAIKVLPSAALASDDDRARFYREARAAAQLHHPHIASVFEIDEAVPSDAPHGTPASPFIAMEFIDGETLQERIKRGPLKLDESVRIASEIASALEAAHEKDIVHRDIKSANIMLAKDGTAKVLDFGLAKTNASTKLTQMGLTVGTVAFMSPEQARGEEVDGRSDLYSLGTVMYQMVSGRVPFGGEYEQAILYSILNEDPEPLTTVRTGVPMGLEFIISKLLTKEARHRYQTPADLIADLETVDLAGASMSHRGMSASHTPGRSSTASLKKYWGRMTIAGLVAALFGAGLYGFFARDGGTPAAPIHAALALPDSLIFLNPVWAPDGSRIMFTASDSSFSGSHVVEYDFSTGTVSELTARDGSSAAAYGPDGRVRYVSRGSSLLLIAPNRGSSVVVPDGMTSRQVSWVDGRLHYIRNWTEVWTVDPDEPGGAERLLRSLLPSRSVADSESDLLFLSSVNFLQQKYELSVINIASGDTLTSFAPIPNRRPRALIDDRFLVTVGGLREALGVIPVDLRAREYDGGEQQFFDVAEVAVSPQGHLAFSIPNKERPVPRGEALYQLDGTGAATLLGDASDIGEPLYNDFSFSSDGSRFVVESGRLVLVDLVAGSEVTLLADTTVDGLGLSDAQPFWGQDDLIYFRAQIDSLWTIHSIRPDGTGLEILSSSGLPEGYPSVSQDGEWLAFHRRLPETDLDVFVRNQRTGEEVEIAVANGPQAEPQISPNGQWVVYRSADDLLIASRDGRERTTVAERARTPHWSPDGRTLYYYNNGPPHTIKVRTFSGDGEAPSLEARFGQESILRSIRINHIHIAASPNGLVVSAPGELEEELIGDWRVIFNWANSLEEAFR
jgi:serine/threonine protein kinase